MIRILGKFHQPILGQDIGDALHGLPGEPHVPCNLRNRQRRLLDRTDDLPSGARYSKITGQTVPRCQKTAIQPESFQDQSG